MSERDVLRARAEQHAKDAERLLGNSTPACAERASAHAVLALYWQREAEQSEQRERAM